MAIISHGMWADGRGRSRAEVGTFGAAGELAGHMECATNSNACAHTHAPRKEEAITIVLRVRHLRPRHNPTENYLSRRAPTMP